MKLLTLDVGNTTVDACEFLGKQVKHLGRFPHRDLKIESKDYDLVVAVSVKPSFNDVLERAFPNRLKLLSLDDIPMEIYYKTPHFLGTDRVLFAYGVRELYSEDALLVMAGTALVVDLLLEGKFWGGFITAGVGLKLKALSEKAEGIPHMSLKPTDITVGMSTEEVVLGGTYLESVSFIEKTAERWFKEFNKELPVYITGGDGWLFEKLGTYDPLLLHRAMHRIIINP